MLEVSSYFAERTVRPQGPLPVSRIPMEPPITDIKVVNSRDSLHQGITKRPAVVPSMDMAGKVKKQNKKLTYYSFHK